MLAKRNPIKVAVFCVSAYVLISLVVKGRMRIEPEEIRNKSPSLAASSSANGVSADANIVLSRIRSGSIDRFCLDWDPDGFDVDQWWTHHPDFVIERQNSTHQCFQLEANPEKLDFLRKMYRNQFQAELSGKLDHSR